MSEIINKFNIFEYFPPNLRQNIKSFHVSRNPLSGYVLKENKVYGFGEKIYEILGYNRSNEKYVLINELNDKSIQQFYTGNCFMFARTDENEIYFWGRDLSGQWAYGNEEFLKPEKISFFDRKNIIHISCGYNHYLALSFDGLIYGWSWIKCGWSGCGERRNFNMCDPIKINLNEKIKLIHCTKNSSCAVSFDGNIYYWGENFSKGPVQSIKTPNLTDIRKVYWDFSPEIIILDKSGNVFKFHPTFKIIKHIKSDLKFIDLYCDDNYCLLQSEKCVYQLKFSELFKTNSINFFDFYSQNSLIYEKTIKITKEGYFMSNELHIDYNNRILSSKYEKICDKKYEEIFEEIKKIGEGCYGIVYEVNQKFANVLYAIKIIEIRDISDLNEIEIMSKLNSDVVVKLIDAWVEEKVVINTIKPILYIQMELCEHNLRDFIDLMRNSLEQNFNTFQYFISCELFKELIECVNYLHSLKPPIIHRDLKPENILISEGINGRFLKLCDFGTAKIHLESNHTRMRGTLKYMASEVLHSSKYNMKSDIYSLALIGTEIFDFEDKVEEIRKHKTREDFDKYISKYLNTGLKTKFRNLLDLISNCLLQEDYHSRLDCRQLLEKYIDFSIDKNFVINENTLSLVNIWKLITKIEKQNTILKVFIENKFDLL